MRVVNAGTYAVAPREALSGAARRVLSTSEMFVMVLVPQGGQRTARRNALKSVRSDIDAARDRAEALAAIVPAQAGGHPRMPEHAAS
ncbi:MAG: hypothetical protein QOG53_3355 [Frankiales bacterium]|nr:hypothetical protein [Frankiales bacterium]